MGARGAERGRETKNLKQAPGSELSTQSPMRGSNSGTWGEVRCLTDWVTQVPYFKVSLFQTHAENREWFQQIAGSQEPLTLAQYVYSLTQGLWTVLWRSVAWTDRKLYEQLYMPLHFFYGGDYLKRNGGWKIFRKHLFNERVTDARDEIQNENNYVGYIIGEKYEFYFFFYSRRKK